VCFRESTTSKPVRTAIDGAREMRLNERSVQRYFAGQIQRGWYAPDCGQMLVSSRVRGTVLVQMELETPTYAEVLAEWAEKFPDLATESRTPRDRDTFTARFAWSWRKIRRRFLLMK